MIAEFFAGAGIDQTLNAVHDRVGGPIAYAVVGLGTGALACQRRPGDTLTYYEIDPDVVRIATDPQFFNYLPECAPDARIVLGDARLRLTDAPDGGYDLIFIDAFIGAAIPIHLLTREAVALYLKKLKPGGIVAMHISNRNLELASVAAGVAEANGAIARIYDGGDVEADPSLHHWVPRIAVIARKRRGFRRARQVRLLAAPRARPGAAHLDRRLFEYRGRDTAKSEGKGLVAGRTNRLKPPRAPAFRSVAKKPTR